MSQQPRSTFVLVHPSEILAALVGLKDVRVLHYERRGPHVELMVEQIPGTVRCPSCAEVAQVKERPVVHYVDLPVYGTPMSLAWKKHRMRCVKPSCPRRTWVLDDHRIATKNCLLTTRAAKWATVQVGGGRTVSEVAAELACDWHTVNDAVITYGEALLAADRKRLNKTTAIGLDETSFVKLSDHVQTHFATTVADVEPTRSSTSCRPANTSTWRAGSTSSHGAGRSGSASVPSTCRPPTPRSTRSSCPRPPRWSTPFTSSHSPTAASMRCAEESKPSRPDIVADVTTRSIGPAVPCSGAKRRWASGPPSACGHSSSWATPVRKSRSRFG